GSTRSARTMGLKNAPTCPEVFITELSSAVFRPPRPIAVDQLGASVNIENAPPRAISVPPMRGFDASVPPIIAAAASTYETTPILRIPTLNPRRRQSASVVKPPDTSAIALSVSGSPENIASSADDMPRAFARYVGSQVMKK